MNLKDPISWSAEGPDRFYFKNGYNNNENLVFPEYKLPCNARFTGCEVFVEYNYNLVDNNKKQFIPFYKKIFMDLFGLHLLDNLQRNYNKTNYIQNPIFSLTAIEKVKWSSQDKKIILFLTLLSPNHP